MMEELKNTDQWLEKNGPRDHVVVSSRARYARNLSNYRFAPKAGGEELGNICRTIDEALKDDEIFRSYQRIAVTEISHAERIYLKESHLISVEMEKGGEFRILYLGPGFQNSIMVNEEDHLRMQSLLPGFQLSPALEEMNRLDDQLSERLDFAYSSRWGYLTACPTNTGTALRVSVMLHLPGLVLARQVEEIMKSLQQYGLTVRGFYGEHSDFLGDFFQVSNEITLGKSEEELFRILQTVVEQLIEKEESAREKLFKDRKLYIEDTIWRAYALLSHARSMDSAEAVKLLSKLRLGVDRRWFGSLTHNQLTRLIVDIQPAHLQFHQVLDASNARARDIARSSYLRTRLEHARPSQN
ncbi:MAG: ATP--guanido phosphotransferase [bacterium]